MKALFTILLACLATLSFAQRREKQENTRDEVRVYRNIDRTIVRGASRYVYVGVDVRALRALRALRYQHPTQYYRYNAHALRSIGRISRSIQSPAMRFGRFHSLSRLRGME